MTASFSRSSPCCFVPMSFEGTADDPAWHCTNCDADYLELEDGTLARIEDDEDGLDDGEDLD